MKKSEIHTMQEKVDAYRGGALTEDQIESLWAELVEYPELMEYLINTVNLQALAEKKNKNSDKFSAGKSVPVYYTLLNRWSRIAAIFLVVMGTVTTIYLFGSEEIAEPGPVSEIELNNFRSSTLPTEVFDYEIQRAINHASIEEFEEAIAKLEGIDRESLSAEQRATLQINKGSILYNRGDYTAAIEVFNEMLQSHDQLHVLTMEQAHWFLGNAYLQIGENELAMEHIQKTYDLNGAYRRLAERFLN